MFSLTTLRHLSSAGRSPCYIAGSLRPRYSYSPFKDVFENRIIGRIARYNQDIYMNEEDTRAVTQKIYQMHNSQHMIFYFRLLKLYSLTPTQIDTFIQSQKRKYVEYNSIRKSSEAHTKDLPASFDQTLEAVVTEKSQAVVAEEVEDEEDQIEGKEKEQEEGGESSNSNGGNVTISSSSSSNSLFANIFKTKQELRDVIYMLQRMQDPAHTSLRYYHVFINKYYNRLLKFAMEDVSDETSTFYAFEQAYSMIDRSMVTSEQMTLLLLLLSRSQQWLSMPDVFDSELSGIITPIVDSKIPYSLGKFIIRIGLNTTINGCIDSAEKASIKASASRNYSLVSDGQIHLDSLSLQLFLFDLRENVKNRQHISRSTGENGEEYGSLDSAFGVDNSLFRKFDVEGIVSKLALNEIYELLQTLTTVGGATIEEDCGITNVVRLLIEDAERQVEEFKIYDQILLQQLMLIVGFSEFAETSRLARLLHQVVAGIMNNAQNRSQLTAMFANYLATFLQFCPPDLVDFYPLLELFFSKQSLDTINYQHLIAVYEAMGDTGVDYDEYLNIIQLVFKNHKSEIERNQEELTKVIESAIALNDVKTAEIFGVSIQYTGGAPMKKQKHSLPLDIEYLSDLSDDEEERKEAKNKMKKRNDHSSDEEEGDNKKEKKKQINSKEQF